MRYAFYCTGLENGCCVMYQSENKQWYCIAQPWDYLIECTYHATHYPEFLRDLAFVLPIIDRINIQGPDARKYLREAIKYFAKEL